MLHADPGIADRIYRRRRLSTIINQSNREMAGLEYHRRRQEMMWATLSDGTGAFVSVAQVLCVARRRRENACDDDRLTFLSTCTSRSLERSIDTRDDMG